MRRFLVLLLLLSLLLTGCGDVFAREYEYAAPYTGTGSGGAGAGSNATEISNYNMLKSALLDLINAHAETAAFRFSRYGGSVADDLAEACLEIRTEHPLGAWAVESISYDTSRIVSYYVADLSITYKKTAEEIASVSVVYSGEELRTRLRTLLEDHATGAVLRVYAAQTDETLVRSLLEELYYADPVSIPSRPAAEIETYPAEGANRIFDLRLSYDFSASQLEQMKQTLQRRVPEIAGTVEGEDPTGLALAAAERLSGLRRTETSYSATAYGALVLSAANSEGLALAYQLLCIELGLECQVVRGAFGGMGAEEHYWNILKLDGDYYHVDVSRMAEDPERAFLLDDAALWGEYIWDTERYPACEGALRYADLVPEEEEPEEPEEPATPPNQPTEPPAPTPTESPEPTGTPTPTESPEPTEPPEPSEAPEPPEPTEPAGE